MSIVKIIAGAVLSAALFSGCVTDNYVRSQPDNSYKQYYQGTSPKFMQDPFHNIKVPTYTQMKFKR